MKTGYYAVDSNNNNKLVFIGAGYDIAIVYRNSLYPNSGVYEYDDPDVNMDVEEDDSDNGFMNSNTKEN